MQWSKIKSRLMALVAPTLSDRVDFHQTLYRIHHNDSGGVCTCDAAREIWIMIDKLKVFRASYCKFAYEVGVMRYVSGTSPWESGPEGDAASRDFQRRELHDPRDVVGLLRSYLDMDPHLALQSNDPILKALAIIDRRIGTRKLR